MDFNIIHPTTGLKIDVIIPADTEFNRTRLSRGRMLPTNDGTPACFASPEDAILKKLEYYREGGSDKHVRDIIGVLKVQADAIDYEYLETWAERLGVVEELQEVRAKSGG